LRVLLLSAYEAHSHRYWRDGVLDLLGDWEWDVLSLPPRHFSWRVRGNALYWSEVERDLLRRPRDLVLATSMVDLATLRGLVPELGAVPAALYFHENQFHYPSPAQPHGLLEAQMVSLYSAMAAARLLFNSGWNRDTFIDGCAALLGRLPDFVPGGLAERMRAKSSVLPVPVAPLTGVRPAWPGAVRGGPGEPLRLAWLGRFEHDKGPEGLLHALRALEATGTRYELAVAGPQFRSLPPALARVREEFAHRLVHFGFVAHEVDYHGLLAGADVALSTALHEFQGIALLQAVSAGCIPLVPDREVYPEIYPHHYRYASHSGDPGAEAGALVDRLLDIADQLREGVLVAPEIAAVQPAALAPAYRRELLAAAGAG